MMAEKQSPELRFANSIRNAPDKYRSDGFTLFRWTGTHFYALPDTELEKMAWRFLVETDDKCATPRLAASSARAAILHADPLPESGKNTVIPVKNGYVHISREGEIDVKSHDPALGLTYCLSAEFAEGVEATRFGEFLCESMPDSQTLGFLQEFAGYTLLPDCRHEVAAWLIGPGGNGKSTFANVMQALHEKPVSMSLDALDGFKLSGLLGASLVYVDETPRKINEERMKTLISGGSIEIDRKYRDPITIRPTAKWIVSGNALPALSDHSMGFWRRWVIFPFTAKPSSVQPLLAETIVEQELAGVLNWALAGLVRLLERGNFPALSPLMAAAREAGKRETDSVKGWLDDIEPELNEKAEAGPSKDIIYQHYHRWALRNGFKSVSSEKFWARIKTQLPGLAEKRIRISGKQVRMVGLVHPEFREEF
jgi:putative DNA primase/helicase